MLLCIYTNLSLLVYLYLCMNIFLNHGCIQEMQGIERVRSKLQEKTALKRSKNVKTQQDKLNKEKSTMRKMIKDTKGKIRTEVASKVKSYSKDLSTYLEGVKSNLKNGRDEVQRCAQSNEMLEQENSAERSLTILSTKLDKALFGDSNDPNIPAMIDYDSSTSVEATSTKNVSIDQIQELWSTELRLEEEQECAANAGTGGMRLSNTGESKRGSGHCESLLDSNE